jgi:hypothetical protein
MRIIQRLVLLLLALSLATSVAMATPPAINDPDKYAAEVMRLLVKGDMAAVAKTVADSIGKPDSADGLKNALGMFSGKTIDYSDKVIDNTFGKGLRQIVYYSFIDNIGFIYYRFNFKMSSKGWILAHFVFKTETNELFPKDFVDR